MSRPPKPQRLEIPAVFQADSAESPASGHRSGSDSGLGMRKESQAIHIRMQASVLGSKPMKTRFRVMNTLPSSIICRTCRIRVYSLKLLDVVKKLWKHDQYELAIVCRMRGTRAKDKLRSSLIPFRIDDGLNFYLGFEFDIEYWHYLKSDSNTLQIVLLKRRGRNRPFKNAAYLHISMEEAMQHDIKGSFPLDVSKHKSRMPLAELKLQIVCRRGRLSEELLGTATESLSEEVSAIIDANEMIYREDADDIELSNSDDVSDDEESVFATTLAEQEAIPSGTGDETDTVPSKPRMVDRINRVREQGTRFFGRIRGGLLKRSEGDIDVKEVFNASTPRTDRSTDAQEVEQSDSDSLSHVTDDSVDEEKQLVESFPSMDQQTEHVLSQKQQDGDQVVTVIDLTQRIGRDLFRSGETRESGAISRSSMLGVLTADDVESLVFHLCTRFKKLELLDKAVTGIHFVLLGFDWVFCAAVRSYVALLDKDPRGWSSLTMHCIPLSITLPDRSRIATVLSRHDTMYRSQFYSSGWENLASMEQGTKLLTMVEHAVALHLQNAVQAYKIPIAGAMLDMGDNDQELSLSMSRITVPFIRSFEVVAVKRGSRDKDSHFRSLSNPYVQMDVWRVGETKKESCKVLLESLLVQRLFDESDGARIEDINELLDAGIDVDCRKGFYVTATSFSKDKKIFKRSKKESGIQTTTMFASKVILSVPSNSNFSFKVRVDGIPSGNVTFISLSPSWSGRCKYFPVASMPRDTI